jgi:hypothetical protein
MLAYGMRGENHHGDLDDMIFYAGMSNWTIFPIVGSAPKLFQPPKVSSVAPEHKAVVSDPTFQQRLDALAARVAAMEANIEFLK